MNETKWIFIHSWHLFHSKSLQILLHSVWRMLHSLSHFSLWWLKMSFHSPMVGVSLCFISVDPNFNCNFIPSWQLSHPIFHSAMVTVSCNISFILAIISIEFSFLHGSYFINPWILVHPPLVAVSCNISSLLAFIPIKLSFLYGSYFILSWILSHFPLAAISCNISFLLAFISIKFSFLHGSYFILSWTLSHFSLAAISCDISFLLAFIFISSW